MQVRHQDGQSDLLDSLARASLSVPKPLTSLPISNIPGTKATHFPESGYLRQFIQKAEQDHDSQRQVVAVVMFAAEGDNSGDAQEMASLIAKTINVEVKEWEPPKSWEGLFGEAVRRGAEEGLFW